MENLKNQFEGFLKEYIQGLCGPIQKVKYEYTQNFIQYSNTHNLNEYLTELISFLSFALSVTTQSFSRLLFYSIAAAKRGHSTCPASTSCENVTVSHDLFALVFLSFISYFLFWFHFLYLECEKPCIRAHVDHVSHFTHL